MERLEKVTVCNYQKSYATSRKRGSILLGMGYDVSCWLMLSPQYGPPPFYGPKDVGIACYTSTMVSGGL